MALKTLLSINNYYYQRGGAETVFFSHNKLFNDMGWQVIPFSMQHPKNVETEWSKYFVQEIDYASEYSFMEKLNRIPKVIYSLEARSKVGEIIKNCQIDICHIHNIYHHISPSILSLIKKNNIPTLFTLHDLKILCPAYNMYVKGGVCERCKTNRIYNVLIHRCIKDSVVLSTIVMLEAFLYRTLRTYNRYVDRFIVPSHFYIDKFVEWGWDRKRFIYIPNFINTEIYMPDYTPSNEFIYFGRLSREKGLITMIKACAASNVSIKIVGTGPDKDDLVKLANNIGADVKFLGYLTGIELFDAIRSSRAVVLPSECYENAPMSIIESYALGKPVIGSNIGGIPELIKNKETGITFEAGSIDGLAAAFLWFQQQPNSQIAEMGQSSRSWVEKEFSSEQYKQRMLDLYKSYRITSAY